MKTNPNPKSAVNKDQARLALGLVTVAFAVGLVMPTPAAAEPEWGTTYLNPAGTMAVCVCDGGDHCAPCSNLN